MTGRDRIVIVVLGALAVLAAAWLLVLAPEREKASKLGGEVSAAQAQLVSAESQLSSARSAQAGYTTAYTSLVSLGKAVPTGQEVPSLIYELEHASNQKQVEFASITSGGSSRRLRCELRREILLRPASPRCRSRSCSTAASSISYNLFQQLEPLHPAHELRRPAGQRPPAHDPGRPVGPGGGLGLRKARATS